MIEAMNDNDRRVSIAERLSAIETRESPCRDSDEAKTPKSGRSRDPALRRQIDNWVNEGGANDE